MTAATRATALLMVVAGLFAAWGLATHGFVRHGVFGMCLGIACGTLQLVFWTWSRSRPALQLERRADGTLQVRRGSQGPVPVWVGSGTRLLGPSVFLDLSFAFNGRRERCRRWITPLDAPADARRRWRVVLSDSGRQATW